MNTINDYSKIYIENYQKSSKLKDETLESTENNNLSFNSSCYLRKLDNCESTLRVDYVIDALKKEFINANHSEKGEQIKGQIKEIILKAEDKINNLNQEKNKQNHNISDSGQIVKGKCVVVEASKNISENNNELTANIVNTTV